MFEKSTSAGCNVHPFSTLWVISTDFGCYQGTQNMHNCQAGFRQLGRKKTLSKGDIHTYPDTRSTTPHGRTQKKYARCMPHRTRPGHIVLQTASSGPAVRPLTPNQQPVATSSATRGTQMVPHSCVAQAHQDGTVVGSRWGTPGDMVCTAIYFGFVSPLLPRFIWRFFCEFNSATICFAVFSHVGTQ